MGVIDNLPSKSAFWTGVVGGILATCAVGFFVTLPIVLKGGGLDLQDSDTAPTAPVQAKGNATDPVISLAREIGLNEKNFTSCLNGGTQTAKVRQSMTEGQAIGVNGTPASILLTKDGKSKLISGAVPFEAMKQAIDAMLAGKTEVPGSEATQGTVPPVGPADHIRGNANAKLSIIVYTDFECPFCKRHHPTMEQVVQEYGDQVAWVYRQFPLTSLHPNAMKYAEATECAAELGGNSAFWKLADGVIGRL